MARALLGATEEDWRLVRWIPPSPPAGDFLPDPRSLGEDLVLVRPLRWKSPLGLS